jgi:hypothetical protein
MRPRALGRVDRQIDMPAIRKFQIAQMDTQTPLAAAAALDHVAGPDRKSVRKTIGWRIHGNSPRTLPAQAFMPDRMRRFRDTAAIDVDCCESLWKGA